MNATAASRRTRTRALAVSAERPVRVPVNHELVNRPPRLAAALNILASAALAYRRIVGEAEPVWTWIGFFSRSRPLAPPPPLRS